MKIYNKITKTYPVLLHKNGPDNEYSLEMKNLYESINWEIPAILENCTIYTWNNKPYPGDFEKSLLRSDIPFKTLGKGITDWVNIERIGLFLKENTNTKYVLCSDCFDVKIIGNISKCVEFLKKSKSKAVFGADLGFWPVYSHGERLFQEMKFNSTPFKYLNAGTVIAETEFYKEICDRFESLKYQLYYEGYDQHIFHRILFDLWPEMTIDNNCEIFQTIHFLDRNNLSII